MFREIVEGAKRSNYDFRLNAHPDDPLRYLFDEWVPYYRGKWAIAKSLRPARILEIGVRYGYSALAFLDACPLARYLGIDLDSELHGGTRGAIQWAREATRGYAADFMIADSQKFDTFPGGRYDLIHVDRQQDQPDFLHDLELAVRQARYVLVDGYFWTRDNFLSASEFLFRNKGLIEFYGVIPGYAGDLLIVLKEGLPDAGQPGSSADIRGAYTRNYYLGDCGGFDSFKRTRGLKLEDPRLRAVAQIAALAPPGRALDLGSGRGEMSFSLAKLGFEVTAIDYSPDAIALAQSARDADDTSMKITYVCDDLTRAPMDGRYSVAVAADVIEHLAPAELDELYRRVSSHLSSDGLFVIHTFPNAWYYRYEHSRKLRIARSIGAYVPLNPRSRFEQLMHINEQSPRVLRQQLSRHFQYVLLWFSGHDMASPFENLWRKFSIREMSQSGDLFAVASNHPLDPPSLGREFRMEAASSIARGDIDIQALSWPATRAAGSCFTVDLLIKNRSAASLKSCLPFPVHLSYHWLDAVSREVAVFDGERTPLDPALATGRDGRYSLFVRAPLEKSLYCLRATLVQESIRWLDDAPVEAFTEVFIEVN